VIGKGFYVVPRYDPVSGRSAGRRDAADSAHFLVYVSPLGWVEHLHVFGRLLAVVVTGVFGSACGRCGQSARRPTRRTLR
jgi:hypothetical protein